MAKLEKIIQASKEHFTRNKRKYKIGSKIFLGVNLITTLGISLYTYHQISTWHNRWEETKGDYENYLRSNKESIEREIEREVGIEIEGVNLSFADRIEDNDDTVMQYEPAKDVIIVSREYASPFHERGKLPAEQDNKTQTTKGDYIHELGHDYTHQIYMELKVQGKLHFDYTFWVGFDIANDLITEGIAEYFAISSGENLPRMINNLPQTKEDIVLMYFSKGYYEIGRRIVTPILNKMGVENGIRAILTQPAITDLEIVQPELYYKRILKSASPKQK